MVTELQKPGFGKRLSAWLFDIILLATVAVLCATAVSAVVGYDAKNAQLEQIYDSYETQYGTDFEIDQETYEAMDEADRANYDAAYNALIADEEALYMYNLVVQLTLLITGVGIFLAVLLLEFVVPLFFKNGQTLGKKIFGIGVMRTDGIRLTTVQLFVRTVLGKYAVEIMIPVFVVVMLFLGIMGTFGATMLIIVVLGQIISLIATQDNRALHDLLASTVTVDIASQRIFGSTEEMIEYTKAVHAQKAKEQNY